VLRSGCAATVYLRVGVEDVTLEHIWPYNMCMDWLRRNWPDLLIGVALVVVIAMIVITLLSGGSLASLVRRDTPQPLATSTGGAQTTNGSATASGDAAAGSTSTNTQANTSANNQTNAQANTPADGATTGDGYDVFVPGVPGRETAADGGQAGEAAGVGGDASASGDQTTDAGAEVGAADAALPATSQTGGFRVAAGATNSRDGARALAESYREDGLEVTVEQKDDLYLLWVGPYGIRADADVTAETIIAGGGDALVYSYDGESDDTEAAADIADESVEGTEIALPDTANGVTQNAVTENSVANGAGNGDGTVLADNGATRIPAAGNANAGTTRAGTSGNSGATAGNAATGNATTGNTAPGNEVAEDLAVGAGTGERYLQVGAFASDASAAPRLAQLEQLSLNVTSSEDAGGLLRLFVGPYGEAQISQLQARLNARGIESFPVSQ